MARFGTRALVTGALAALALGLAAAPAPAAPVVEDVTPSAAWSCNGIPNGMVSLQIDPYRCGGTYPGHLVSAPASGQWICGWMGSALDGFVIDRTEPMTGACHFNASWHIVAV